MALASSEKAKCMEAVLPKHSHVRDVMAPAGIGPFGPQKGL